MVLDMHAPRVRQRLTLELKSKGVTAATTLLLVAVELFAVAPSDFVSVRSQASIYKSPRTRGTIKRFLLDLI